MLIGHVGGPIEVRGLHSQCRFYDGATTRTHRMIVVRGRPGEEVGGGDQPENVVDILYYCC